MRSSERYIQQWTKRIMESFRPFERYPSLLWSFLPVEDVDREGKLFDDHECNDYMNFHFWSDLYWYDGEHRFAGKLNELVNELLVESVHFPCLGRDDENLKSIGCIFIAISERSAARNHSFQLHSSMVYLVDVYIPNNDRNRWTETLWSRLFIMWSEISSPNREISSLKINSIEWVFNEN